MTLSIGMKFELKLIIWHLIFNLNFATYHSFNFKAYTSQLSSHTSIAFKPCTKYQLVMFDKSFTYYFLSLQFNETSFQTFL